MKFYHYPIKPRQPVEIYAKLQHFPYSLFFDSADASHQNSQYSYIAYHPLETIEYKDGKVSITNQQQQLSFIGDPFKVIDERLNNYRHNFNGHPKLPPFQGGLAGYFGYDLARAIEALPMHAQSDPDMPDMAVGIYDRVYVYDHHKEKATLMIHAKNEQEAKTKLQHFKSLTLSEGENDDHTDSNATLSTALDWHSSHTKESYTKDIEEIIKYIYAGDIFQANMSQRFHADLPEGFDPFSHYRHLRQVNAAPFSGYMNFGDVQISSSSPERFLSLQNNEIETKPIKGTRPRSKDIAIDQKNRDALTASEKDRAENAMIVDLMRNDLSKVCADYSVTVPALCDIESFATVHHLVSTINGRLRADKTAVDLLRGCFPGGSITGAPKVRAMEIIEEREPQRRGPYCGSMGYIDFNGNMDTNIVIRTLIYSKNQVSFNVGGGIVADSVPEAEYQETLDKAAALFSSFETYAGAKKKKVA